MKTIYLILCLLLSSLCTNAQVSGSQPPPCYTDQLWTEMVRADPSLLIQRRETDDLISRFSEQLSPAAASRAGSNPTATVIPIVVYVVYDSAAVNISMRQIQSQVDQLNNDFALYGYTFCYAKRNVSDTMKFVPQAGDSAGVFRINSALSNVSPATDLQLKSLSPLPSQNYLKIYIVHTISPQGVLGYAIMPGGSAALDGIVVRADVFGSRTLCSTCQLLTGYDRGSTLTHEVGHYLDLYHTFQGGCDTGTTFQSCQVKGDRICDTPPTDGSFGCPAVAPLSCNGVDRELTENYMDYTEDRCKNSFTAGQKTRMDYAVQLYRRTLVSDANLINTGVLCKDLTASYANFYCANYNGCTGRQMTFASQHSAGFTYTWTFGDGSTGSGDTVRHTYAAAGTYQVELRAVNTSINVSVTKSDMVFITACTPITCSTDRYEFEYGYLDFSSGTPIATSHPAIPAIVDFADFYYIFYRGYHTGRPFFHISSRVPPLVSEFRNAILDSNFVTTDSLGFQGGTFGLLVPVPRRTDTYCYMTLSYPSLSDLNLSLHDTLQYTIIGEVGGRPRALPGKKLVPVPYPPGFPVGGVSSSSLNYTAIPGCDDRTAWIIVNFANSRFLVYRLDSTGTVSYHQSYTIPALGYAYRMTASPDGRHLAIQARTFNVDSAFLYILDFDKGSGNLTGYRRLYSAYVRYIGYGVGKACFSPNSRFLYQQSPCCTQSFGNTFSLYQYDLYSAAPAATARVIYQSTVSAGQLPLDDYILAPDGRIYIGHVMNPGNTPLSYRLGVISHPDVLENGSNSIGYNPKGPDIVPADCPFPLGVSYVGFNRVLDQTDAYGCDRTPGVPLRYSYSATGCRVYTFHSDDCFSAQWDFGDAGSGSANSSTLSSPSHVFPRAGRYRVTLTASGYTFTDSIDIQSPTTQIAGTAVAACPVPHAGYSLTDVRPGVRYSWTVTHGTPAVAQGSYLDVQWSAADTAGTITVVAQDTVLGCADTSVLHVSYHISGLSATTDIYDTICSGSAYTFGIRHLTAAGTYSDTTLQSGGCMSIRRLSLAVTAPAVTWTGTADTIGMHAGVLTLSGGSPAGGIYSGPGVSGTTFDPAAAGIGNATVVYTYTDASGCTASVSRTFVVVPAGISTIDPDMYISLYPNPATGMIEIHSDLLLRAGMRMQLYDMTGRMIAVPVERNADKAILDLEGIAPGVYTITFRIEGHEAIRRFVKIG